MHTVAAIKTEGAFYLEETPFHPDSAYPEYPFKDHIIGMPNHAYRGIRELFRILEYDKENFGTPNWNPLGWLVQPGNTVVLKPNFVLSFNDTKQTVWAVITHPSVLRAIADYVWIALKGSGKIIFADAPQYNCNHEELPKITRLPEVCAFYKNFAGPSVEFRDLRPYWSRGKHFSSMMIPLPGDPQGSRVINLGEKSTLYQKPHDEKLYGAVYQRSEVICHHTGKTHEYQVSQTIMDADVVISVPKLKVHKKVGVTLNVKGLVGINTNKNYLVHYTLTPPSKGGDQYPDKPFTPVEEFLICTERWMYDHFLAPNIRILEYLHRSIYWLHNHTTKKLGIKVAEWKRLLDAGNWYGNDSAWRMAVDLARLFVFSGKDGKIYDKPQRRMFTVIDGIIGGENNGPLSPDPNPAGTLIASENLLAADIVASRLMGFDPMKMKMHTALFEDREFDLGVHSYDDIKVVSSQTDWLNCLRDQGNAFLNFKPHPGWVGHIEIKPSKKIIP